MEASPEIKQPTKGEEVTIVICGGYVVSGGGGGGGEMHSGVFLFYTYILKSSFSLTMLRMFCKIRSIFNIISLMPFMCRWSGNAVYGWRWNSCQWWRWCASYCWRWCRCDATCIWRLRWRIRSLR